MADAIHNLVKTQLSSVAPYISMGRLYTKMAAVNLRRTCAMRTFDVIENALYTFFKAKTTLDTVHICTVVGIHHPLAS